MVLRGLLHVVLRWHWTACGRADDISCCVAISDTIHFAILSSVLKAVSISNVIIQDSGYPL